MSIICILFLLSIANFSVPSLQIVTVSNLHGVTGKVLIKQKDYDTNEYIVFVSTGKEIIRLSVNYDVYYKVVCNKYYKF